MLQVPQIFEPEEQIYKGAYILKKETLAHKITLIATGSEVYLAAEAQKELEKDNMGTRLVSMPCMELFLQLSASEKNAILGDAYKIAVEAGIRFGWSEVIGEKGGFVGMTGFGDSAPAKQLYEYFSITVDDVIKLAKSHVKL